MRMMVLANIGGVRSHRGNLEVIHPLVGVLQGEFDCRHRTVPLGHAGLPGAVDGIIANRVGIKEPARG